MVVRGGMGTVTSRLAELRGEGRRRDPHRPRGDRHRDHRRGGDRGDHRGRVRAGRGWCWSPPTPTGCPGCSATATPAALRARIDGYAERSPGQTMKVNLALAGLPRFAALPDPGRGQHGTTVHLLPPPVDGSVLAALRLAFDDAAAGRLPAAPAAGVVPALHAGPVAGRRRRQPLLGAVRAGRAARGRRLVLGRRAGPVRRPAARPGRGVRTGHPGPARRRARPGAAGHPRALRHHQREHHARRQLDRLRRPHAVRAPASTGSTPVPPAATRPARSSARPATTRPSRSSPTSAEGNSPEHARMAAADGTKTR